MRWRGCGLLTGPPRLNVLYCEQSISHFRGFRASHEKCTKSSVGRYFRIQKRFIQSKTNTVLNDRRDPLEHINPIIRMWRGQKIKVSFRVSRRTVCQSRRIQKHPSSKAPPPVLLETRLLRSMFTQKRHRMLELSAKDSGHAKEA